MSLIFRLDDIYGTFPLKPVEDIKSPIAIIVNGTSDQTRRDQQQLKIQEFRMVTAKWLKGI